jgi:general secretion pathway protein I
MNSNAASSHGGRHGDRADSTIRPSAAQHGFTLVEVVVALAIVVVSFMALYGVIMQMVNATTLMQEKTIASWVAFDQITELRLKTELPGSAKSNGVKEMAGLTWLYSVELRETGSEKIRQVIVTVAPEDEPDRTLGLASGVVFSAAPVNQAPGSAPDPNSGPGSPIVSGASPDWEATQ